MDPLQEIQEIRENTELLISECTNALVNGVLSNRPSVPIASMLKILNTKLVAERCMEDMIRSNPAVVYGLDSPDRVRVFNMLVKFVNDLIDKTEKITKRIK